jgi:DNA repair ATPase RecN
LKCGSCAKQDRTERPRQRSISVFRSADSAGLRPGEEEELSQTREVLKNAGKIAALVEQAIDLSYAGEESLLPLLARLKAVLKDLSPFEPSVPASLRTVEEFGIFLDELGRGLMRFKDGTPGGPESLEAVEERLDAIDKLKRKYGPVIPEILAHLEAVREERTGAEERLEGLTGNRKYKPVASARSSARGRTAELERLVEKNRPPGMKKAAFKAEGHALPFWPSSIRTGTEDVEFSSRPIRRRFPSGRLRRAVLAMLA